MKRTIIGQTALAVMMASTASAATVLDVVAWKGNEAEPAGMPELIEKFESENPDIDVELTFVARKDVDKVIPPRLQAGTPPDVTMVDGKLVALWGGAGLLDDLGTSTEWYNNLIPSVRDIVTLDDKALSYPLEVIGMGNFVNMDLLAKVGIDKAPVTIDALKASCSALAAAGISPMIFAGGFPAMLFVGANGIDPKGISPTEYSSGDRQFVGDDNFNRTFDLVRELVGAECFDPKLQAGLDPWATAPQEFKAGNVAILPQGAWNIGQFNDVEGLNYQFAPMPSVHTDYGLALDLVGPGWAIPKDAAHKEAAAKWIEFFSREENLNVFLKAEGAYSPYQGGKATMPDLATPYTDARAKGSLILWPFSTQEFPSALQSEWEDSITGFLLNIDAANEKTLQRWDDVIEDNL
ncbi:carbohydrate ABC transporter substrate-binding protein, CUT1 family [Epibacterium ulvae]|uniref:Carbohydrate ABC transporter substrate-binding protein, CUT1 family n=1 Tax=Epibacterium ulvae TaxID=1156985 RepID=A0A1G5RAN1_9RHOB|nr:ABC transporter substrate-binding protein [Epibacterium ulvae]SCZ70908.1 carbohydrate ABC transporter substrate-binding protein, CUT1 family [Epibacterium ulvae]